MYYYYYIILLVIISMHKYSVLMELHPLQTRQGHLAHVRARRPAACGRRGRRALGAAAIRTCTEKATGI